MLAFSLCLAFFVFRIVLKVSVSPYFDEFLCFTFSSLFLRMSNIPKKISLVEEWA